MSQKYHLFVLNPGYVESTRLSVMIVHHVDGFENPIEAAESFRQVLVDYVTPPDRQLNECCQSTIDEFPQASYCHECGNRTKKTILAPRVLNLKVAEAFEQLAGSCIDSASDCGMYELFEDAGWELSGDCFHLTKYPFIFIWNLYHWMAEGGGDQSYLEWHFQNGKSGNNRGP